MAYKIAKLLLEHAKTFLDRKEAIRSAMGLGMPLDQIESYLDWLDMVQGEPSDKNIGNNEIQDDPELGSNQDS